MTSAWRGWHPLIQCAELALWSLCGFEGLRRGVGHHFNKLGLARLWKRAEADNPYRDLDYSGYYKTRI